jgi:hypothetical protein
MENPLTEYYYMKENGFCRMEKRIDECVPFIIILSKKEKVPLILSAYWFKIVFIKSSFRLNAFREI